MKRSPTRAIRGPRCEECASNGLMAKELVLTRGPSQDQVELMDELWCMQGAWYRIDGSKMGDVIDSNFLWDARVKSKEEMSPLRLEKHLLVMFVDGQQHTAVIHLHAQPTLRWSDGDVWLLK
ncbi:unnamed protein product [Durusdinium trenchii]|uniref:Uncharacterized protein n=1 Tax=Durusdinium trenchii TaxID=1381693 RepID=A0ABP0S1K3_9DINO